MPRRGKSIASGLVGTALLVLVSPAHALDPEVTSDTAAQFYDVRSPTGETVLARRRLTTTLGVGVYDLIDHPTGDPLAPELSFRARVRYDADYGASPSESDGSNAGNRLVPGYSSEAVDVMYAYLEGRRFWHGFLSFRLGRQYLTDVLGWWSFDGGEAKITTPYFVAVEGYGGLEQRGGLPLSSSRFESDGIMRGDRNGYDPSLYPQFQPASIAPAFGAALETAGVTWLHARLTYRRVYNEGSSNVTQFASGLYAPAGYDGARISSERVGYALDANIFKIGAIKGGFNYDLYNAKMASIYASVDAYFSQKVTASLDYNYYAPTFDGDSIWNFFLGEPMSDIGARLNVQPTRKLSISMGTHTRITAVETSQTSPNASPNIANLAPGQTGSYFPTNGMQFDGGGNVAAKYKWGQGYLGVRSSGNFGPEGDRIGGDVNVEETIERRYILEGRVGTWQWDDKLRPDRDATDFQYVAGVGYRFAPRSQALVEWQHDMNRLVGQRFRLMVWLTLAVTK